MSVRLGNNNNNNNKTLFKEDNIFGTSVSLTYGPHCISYMNMYALLIKFSAPNVIQHEVKTYLQIYTSNVRRTLTIIELKKKRRKYNVLRNSKLLAKISQRASQPWSI